MLWKACSFNSQDLDFRMKVSAKILQFIEDAPPPLPNQYVNDYTRQLSDIVVTRMTIFSHLSLLVMHSVTHALEMKNTVAEKETKNLCLFVKEIIDQAKTSTFAMKLLMDSTISF